MKRFEVRLPLLVGQRMLARALRAKVPPQMIVKRLAADEALVNAIAQVPDKRFWMLACVIAHRRAPQ